MNIGYIKAILPKGWKVLDVDDKDVFIGCSWDIKDGEYYDKIIKMLERELKMDLGGGSTEKDYYINHFVSKSRISESLLRRDRMLKEEDERVSLDLTISDEWSEDGKNYMELYVKKNGKNTPVKVCVVFTDKGEYLDTVFYNPYTRLDNLTENDAAEELDVSVGDIKKLVEKAKIEAMKEFHLRESRISHQRIMREGLRTDVRNRRSSNEEQWNIIEPRLREFFTIVEEIGDNGPTRFFLNLKNGIEYRINELKERVLAGDIGYEKLEISHPDIENELKKLEKRLGKPFGRSYYKHVEIPLTDFLDDELYEKIIEVLD